MSEIFVDLNLIAANPFQPRKEVDAAAVAELAENIERNTTDDFDGLLQAPTVRKVGATYELAFGHRRLAALRLLGREGMRVQVRELTDLQMFEIAVSENMKRRDLNPIEEAEAIQTYMETFGKTSAEAADFFGKAASTIRGSIRLLNLPTAAQELVRSGEINTAAARGLLVVEKLQGASGVEDVLEAMTEHGEGPLEAIGDVLKFSGESKALDVDEGWVTVSPFPPKHLPPLKEKELRDVLIVEDESELEGKEEDVARLVSFVQGGMEVTDEAFPSFDPDGLERVRVLANPPGCVGCPLHAQLDGDHYCGLVKCAERKQTAWRQVETEAASAKLGIPVYEKARDGAYEKMSPYNSATKKMLTEKHADLRLLAVAGRIYGNEDLDLGEYTQAVVVGKTVDALRKKEEKAGAQESTRSTSQNDWQLMNKLSSATRHFCVRFAWEVGSKAVAGVFEGLTNLALMRDVYGENVDFPEGVNEDALIKQVEKAKKAEGLALMRRLLGMWMLDMRRWNSNDKKVLVKYAKEIGEQVKAWGGKLPKDWEAQAETYQKELEAAWKEIRAAAKG
jgi:ParB/RepB/Spo0J family partition protein